MMGMMEVGDEVKEEGRQWSAVVDGVGMMRTRAC